MATKTLIADAIIVIASACASYLAVTYLLDLKDHYRG